MKPGLELRALRGATTASANTGDAIAKAVAELIEELLQRNDLVGDRLLSVTFSVTADLDACFPAAIARRRADWRAAATGIARYDRARCAASRVPPRLRRAASDRADRWRHRRVGGARTAADRARRRRAR